ncbi:MAG: hypothetical protein MUD01_03260 [Chloroflexaceae bacterium]|jgi:hypothetical protein|nr:hypothetical protein [Chloroflexaceae bacterium]
MIWLINHMAELLGLVLVVLLLTALLSPFEALGWWAGWGRQLAPSRAPRLTVPPPHDAPIRHYVVYITGVGNLAGEPRGRRERAFLHALAVRVPGLLVVHDVFPYSASNTALLGPRWSARFWRWIDRMRVHAWLRAELLVYLRNILQVGVSSDPRYGPIFSLSVAQQLAWSLVNHGYRPDSRIPITLIALSGGAQVALGAAPFLRDLLDCPIRLISIGGVLTDDPGIVALERLYRLHGSADRVPWIGAMLWPGRWPLLRRSPWNRASREGRIITLPMGPMGHGGHNGYFSLSARLPDGTTHVEHTAAVVADILLGRV